VSHHYKGHVCSVKEQVASNGSSVPTEPTQSSSSSSSSSSDQTSRSRRLSARQKENKEEKEDKEKKKKKKSPLESLPSVTCPEALKPLLRELPFEVRFPMELLIASGDLTWSDLSPKELEHIRSQANTYDPAFRHLSALAMRKKRKQESGREVLRQEELLQKEIKGLAPLALLSSCWSL